MAFAQLVLKLAHLNVGGCHLLAQRISARAERRHLCLKLALQHLYLIGGVVEHLCGSRPVSHQFFVALLVLAGLGQLLARGGNLLLHVGLLALIDLLGGVSLLNLQPDLRGVYQSHLCALLYAVALGDSKLQKRSALLCRHGGLCGLECSRGVVIFLVVSATCQHHQPHCIHKSRCFHIVFFLILNS